MNRLIPGWTEVHTLVWLMAVPPVLGTAVVAAGDPGWLALAVAALFVLTVAGALAFDAPISLVFGFAGAAAMIALKQLGGAGVWDDGAFLSSTVETLLFVLAGLAAGVAGGGLRRLNQSAVVTTAAAAEAPVFGSLGLLSASLGEARLAEEVDRAELHGRPLSLLRVETRLHAGTPLSGLERDQVTRTVARLVEGTLRATDIPFAYEENCIVVILPETDYRGTLKLAWQLAESVQRATLVVRPAAAEAVDTRIVEHAQIRFGAAAFPEHGQSAAGLLEAAQEAVASWPISGLAADLGSGRVGRGTGPTTVRLPQPRTDWEQLAVRFRLLVGLARGDEARIPVADGHGLGGNGASHG